MMPQIFLRRPAALAGAILVALTLMGPQAPARAATVDYSLTLPTAATPNPLATSISGAGAEMAENVIGSAPFRTSPWAASNSTLDPDDAGALYSALFNGSGAKTGVTALFDFGDSFNRLSLVWGTPSGFNSLKLLLGGIETFAMTGADAAALSMLHGGGKSVLVTISGVTFDSMEIGADHRALEFANLRTAVVPVPAAGLLLVTALGGLALARRRKAA